MLRRRINFFIFWIREKKRHVIMKTKKRFNFRKICYLMLVLSVLGGISMSYCFGNELKENKEETRK